LILCSFYIVTAEKGKQRQRNAKQSIGKGKVQDSSFFKFIPSSCCMRRSIYIILSNIIYLYALHYNPFVLETSNVRGTLIWCEVCLRACQFKGGKDYDRFLLIAGINVTSINT
jgi:hypothetical protein